MDKTRTTICISGSIANWRDKLLGRTNLNEWHWLKTPHRRVIFFGCYTHSDYLRILWHRGQKVLFWCGSDVLGLQKRPFWRFLLKTQQIRHICENVVEQGVLTKMGISAEIHPMIFDDPSKYRVSFRPSKNPRVFGVYHKGKEKEYGVFKHPQIDWITGLPEKEFNETIKKYQGCVRLNKVDGLAESLAKSVLMGQYQWSIIPYKHMENLNLNKWLKDLKNKKYPNHQGKKYWQKVFKSSLKEILK